MQDVPIVENDENDPYPVNADTERRFYMRSSGIMKHFATQGQGAPLLNPQTHGRRNYIKTRNPEFRLYWCLMEFIDWYFRLLLRTVAPLPSL
jgi:hypothetical protein